LKRWTADLGQGVVRINNKFVDKAEILENIKTKVTMRISYLEADLSLSGANSRQYIPM